MAAIPHPHDTPRAGDVAVLDFTDSAVQEQINELMTACEEHDGHLPFGDHELLAIASGTTLGHVGFGVMRDGMLAGYGHLSKLGDEWFCEVAVHPSRRRHGIATHILDAIIGHVSAHGGGGLSTWAYHLDGPAGGLARHARMKPVRTLFQLRLANLPSDAPQLPAGYELDRFKRGRDEQAWLALNARAFAGLPDQGNWTERDLSARFAAPWFREDDVLLLRKQPGGMLAGTCWCKVDPHARTRDGKQIGEIYVIGVDPAVAGEGLGRTMVLIGLAHLRSRGADAGMLYVDSRNTRAIKLYDSLGFRVHHEDVCLATTIVAT